MKKLILAGVIGVFVSAMALTLGNCEEVSAACSHVATTTTKAATCSTDGSRVAKCKKCGTSLGTTKLAALGHSWDGGTVTLKATCTTNGTKTFRCTRGTCKATKTSSITKTGHKAPSSYTKKTDATCSKEGKKVKECTKCGKELESKKIVALGHDWDGGTVTLKATCLTTGTRTFKCKRSGCKGTKTSSIAKTTHTESTSYSIKKHATCTMPGEKIKTCTVCGVQLGNAVAIPATKHTAGDFKVTVAAKCTSSGKKVKSCKSCGIPMDEEIIPAIGHNIEWNLSTWFEPTCVSNGSKEGNCKNCGYVKFIIPATGHNLSSAYSYTKKPTCTEKGEKGQQCLTCKNYFNKTEVKALGHKYNSDPEVIWEPTYGGTGEGMISCTECEYVDAMVVLRRRIDDPNNASTKLVNDALKQMKSFYNSTNVRDASNTIIQVGQMNEIISVIDNDLNFANKSPLSIYGDNVLRISTSTVKGEDVAEELLNACTGEAKWLIEQSISNEKAVYAFKIYYYALKGMVYLNQQTDYIINADSWYRADNSKITTAEMSKYILQCIKADGYENADTMVSEVLGVISNEMNAPGMSDVFETALGCEKAKKGAAFVIIEVAGRLTTKMYEYVGEAKAAEYRAEHPENVMFKEDGDKCVTIIIYHGYEQFKKGLENLTPQVTMEVYFDKDGKVKRLFWNDTYISKY